MTTELVERPAAAALTPLELIQSLVERPDLDPDKLGKLLDLQERWERNRAAEAFGAAVAKFQAKCPIIHKARTATINSSKGSYKYQFASFDDVMRTAAPLLAECGLAVSFSTEPAENGIKSTCRVRHGTHYEDHTLTVPIPSMNVNDTQRYGAALSYAKRYNLCAALNIVVSDEDNDAESLCERITEDQIATLNEWIESTNTDLNRFLKWLAVDSLADMSADQFNTALYELKRKANKR
jgi:hypothetical protein